MTGGEFVRNGSKRRIPACRDHVKSNTYVKKACLHAPVLKRQTRSYFTALKIQMRLSQGRIASCVHENKKLIADFDEFGAGHKLRLPFRPLLDLYGKQKSDSVFLREPLNKRRHKSDCSGNQEENRHKPAETSVFKGFREHHLSRISAFFLSKAYLTQGRPFGTSSSGLPART